MFSTRESDDPGEHRFAITLPEVSQLGHAASQEGIRIAGMDVLRNWRICKIALIVVFAVGVPSGAQTVNEDDALTTETHARGYWVDSSSGLMWAAKDNGKDVNWHYAPEQVGAKTILHFNLGSKVHGGLLVTGQVWSSSQNVDDRGKLIGNAWYFDFVNVRRSDDDGAMDLCHNIRCDIVART